MVSGDPAIRTDWTAYLYGLGLRTRECGGPAAPGAACALAEGAFSCPLHALCDVALYDQECVTPLLALRLIRASRALPIAFAGDRLARDGRHRPAVTAVASAGRDPDGCFGIPLDKLGR